MHLKSVWGWSENCKLRKSTGANRSGAFLYHGPDRIRTDDPHNANVVRSPSPRWGRDVYKRQDKEAFREATSGMVDEYCAQYPGVQSLLDIINSIE